MSDQKQLHRDTIWPVRAFACPVCNNFTPFESDRCHNCQTNVGLHLPTKTMVAVIDDCATVDGQRWVRCTQHEALGCNWLAPEEQEKYQRGRCLADSLIRREPAAADAIAREKLVPTGVALRRLVYQLCDIGLPVDPFWRLDGGLAHYLHITDTIDTGREAGMVLHADRVRFSAPRSIEPLESYEDVPVERMLFDWRWMSMFFNRVNTAMGKDPLYPFDIPPPVVAKLAFIHRVIRETARRN